MKNLKLENKSWFFCFCDVILLLNEFLVWIVMGIIFKDIIDIMSEVDKRVVKFSFGFLLILFLNCVLNYIKNVCNVFLYNINEFWDENDVIERVIDMMI